MLDISEESLNINIIYLKDGQNYFTFHSDCASTPDTRIVAPVAMIYTSNIYCNYAHSIVSQWLYFYPDEENTEDVYQNALQVAVPLSTLSVCSNTADGIPLW